MGGPYFFPIIVNSASPAFEAPEVAASIAWLLLDLRISESAEMTAETGSFGAFNAWMDQL